MSPQAQFVDTLDKVMRGEAVAGTVGLSAAVTATLAVLNRYGYVAEGTDLDLWFGLATAWLVILIPLLRSRVWSQNSVDQIKAGNG